MLTDKVYLLNYFSSSLKVLGIKSDDLAKRYNFENGWKFEVKRRRRKKYYTDENKDDCEGMRDGYHDDDEDFLVRVSKIYVKHV